MATTQPLDLEGSRLPSGMILVKFIEGQPPYQKNQVAGFIDEAAVRLVESGAAKLQKAPRPALAEAK